MIKDELIQLPHEPHVSNEEYNTIKNVESKNDYRSSYKHKEYQDDAYKELKKIAKAYSKVRRLTRDEFDSIPLHELIFTHEVDQKMFNAQVILQNSKFVTFPNNRRWRKPTIIFRTKNAIDQRDIGGIDFGSECWEDITYGGSSQNFAQVKYWYDGYALFLRVDARDDFNWEHDSHSHQDDWLSHMSSIFKDFAHGNRFKNYGEDQDNHPEHALNYKSFRSHVGATIVESIPSMYIFENDDKIAGECERLYNKYIHRIAKRIDIDDLSVRLSTNENLEDLIYTLPIQFRTEFSSINHYEMTSTDYDRRYLYSFRDHPDADYSGYKKSDEKRKRVNMMFKIHILPKIKKFVAKHGGDSYESSLTKMVEDNIQLFGSNDVDDIVQQISVNREPTVSIYNTIVALK